MHTNVRSLSKNFNNLVILLRLLNNEFSCIGISETGLNTSSPINMFDIPMFLSIRHANLREVEA